MDCDHGTLVRDFSVEAGGTGRSVHHSLICFCFLWSLFLTSEILSLSLWEELSLRNQ